MGLEDRRLMMDDRIRSVTRSRFVLVDASCSLTLRARLRFVLVEGYIRPRYLGQPAVASDWEEEFTAIRAPESSPNTTRPAGVMAPAERTGELA